MVKYKAPFPGKKGVTFRRGQDKVTAVWPPRCCSPTSSSFKSAGTCILGKESVLFSVPTWGPAAALDNRGHNSAWSHCKSPGNCPEAAAVVAAARAQGTGVQKHWAVQSCDKEVGRCCWSHCDSHCLCHPRHYRGLQRLQSKHSLSTPGLPISSETLLSLI